MKQFNTILAPYQMPPPSITQRMRASLSLLVVGASCLLCPLNAQADQEGNGYAFDTLVVFDDTVTARDLSRPGNDFIEQTSEHTFILLDAGNTSELTLAGDNSEWYVRPLAPPSSVVRARMPDRGQRLSAADRDGARGPRQWQVPLCHRLDCSASTGRYHASQISAEDRRRHRQGDATASPQRQYRDH
jgi:hypothetical protein